MLVEHRADCIPRHINISKHTDRPVHVPTRAHTNIPPQNANTFAQKCACSTHSHGASHPLCSRWRWTSGATTTSPRWRSAGHNGLRPGGGAAEQLAELDGGLRGRAGPGLALRGPRRHGPRFPSGGWTGINHFVPGIPRPGKGGQLAGRPPWSVG